MIDTIIFDLGGVLTSDSPITYSNKLCDYSKVLELAKVSKADASRIWNRHWKDMKLGKKDMQDFWKDFSKTMDKSVSLHEVIELYNSSVKVDEEMLYYVKGLKNKFRLLALTNECKTGIELRIQKFGLDMLFEKIYCSARIGMVKPDPSLFKHVLSDSRLDASRCIFIDDKTDNVKAAEKMGIRSILFENIEQLKKELAKI
ncbi:HAD family phosphatase [Candidatus Woesearchaeota archaeon]|nr:HAD family phosphatase [Candidatus Woesearchaeota archaeon]